MVSFKRLILRAVLRHVSPMVFRLISVPDHMDLAEFHQTVLTILGWNQDLGYIIRVHGKEFNSFRRKTRSKALNDLRLHRGETFLYICDTLHMWEWDIRVLDIEDGSEDDCTPVCLGGRGAAPPENCGGPKGYRLMLKRQQGDEALFKPYSRETGIEMIAKAFPDQSPAMRDLLRSVLDESIDSIDRRLKESGPLQPDRFILKEVNERLSELKQYGRYRP